MWDTGFWITEKKGNNAFSYEKRGVAPKIFVAPRKEGTVDDLKVGDKTVFEEVLATGEVVSCKGLASLLKIKNRNIYVVDNHNLALYVWYTGYNKGIISKGIKLLHIDQHTDMNENTIRITNDTEDEIARITHACEVGNFIVPAIKSGLLSEVTILNTEEKVRTMSIPAGPYILDIDTDFRDPKMGINEEIFSKVKELIAHASLVSIATSPYFMDQHQAIEIVKKLV